MNAQEEEEKQLVGGYRIKRNQVIDNSLDKPFVIKLDSKITAF